MPRIPKPVLRRWAASQPHGFREVMRAYDRDVGANGELNFDYSDTVADFPVFVYGITTDLAIQRLIIARLLEVGVSHTR